MENGFYVLYHKVVKQFTLAERDDQLVAPSEANRVWEILGNVNAHTDRFVQDQYIVVARIYASNVNQNGLNAWVGVENHIGQTVADMLENLRISEDPGALEHGLKYHEARLFNSRYEPIVVKFEHYTADSDEYDSNIVIMTVTPVMAVGDGLTSTVRRLHNGDRVMLCNGSRHPFAGLVGTVGAVVGVVERQPERAFVVYDFGGGNVKTEWFNSVDLEVL